MLTHIRISAVVFVFRHFAIFNIFNHLILQFYILTSLVSQYLNSDLNSKPDNQLCMADLCGI